LRVKVVKSRPSLISIRVYKEALLAGIFILPQGCLDRLKRPEIIRYQLKYAAVEYSDLDDLVGWICENAARVFLILVKLGWSSRIVGFKQYGFVDAHLPIVARCGMAAPFALEVMTAEDDTYHSAFEDEVWTRDDSDIMDFVDLQWSFSAPVLERSRNIHCPMRRTILPIVKRRQEKQGGFSKITKVMFHRTHIAPGCWFPVPAICHR